MGKRYALLLDAGFVKRKIKRDLGGVTASNIERLVASIRKHEAVSGFELHRIYYYDAAPLGRSVDHPLTGESIEYGSTDVFNENVALLKEVAKLPHFALRKGECTHDGWSAQFKKLKRSSARFDSENSTLQVRPTDLKPVIRQKGVDMRIGMDIAALTLKKHVDVIAMVTADSDFVPAMKFARREGAQLHLFTLAHGVKEEMSENCDLLIPASARSLVDLLPVDPSATTPQAC